MHTFRKTPSSGGLRQWRTVIEKHPDLWIHFPNDEINFCERSKGRNSFRYILTGTNMFVFIRAETLKVQEVRLVIDLVKLQRHFSVPSIHRVLTAHSNVKRIHHLPFLKKTKIRRIQQMIPEKLISPNTHKVQRFHGSVNLVHDVVGLTLRSDACDQEKKWTQVN